MQSDSVNLKQAKLDMEEDIVQLKDGLEKKNKDFIESISNIDSLKAELEKLNKVYYIIYSVIFFKLIQIGRFNYLKDNVLEYV